MWIVASSQSTSRPSIQIFFTGSIGIPSSSVWVSGRRTGPRGEVRGLAAAQGYRLPSAPARKRSGGGTAKLQGVGALRPDGPFDLGKLLGEDGAVHGEAHQREAPGLLPPHLHAGDVHPGLAQDGSDPADHAGPVLVDEERHVL